MRAQVEFPKRGEFLKNCGKHAARGDVETSFPCRPRYFPYFKQIAKDVGLTVEELIQSR